jgi:predicted RNase H-like nuclease (RuvC/YqgF family)
MNKIIFYPLLILGSLTFGSHISAEPKQESAGQVAFKKAQGVIRQLTEEKQALESEKAAVMEQVKKLENVSKQLKTLKSEVQLQKSQAENLRNANTTLEAQLNNEREKEQNLHRKIKEIVAQAKLIENDNQLLVSAVREREKWMDQCTDKNKKLVEANHILVDKYQKKGFWDQVTEIEPFTGIGKVETQNTVEAYQFKLEDLKVTDFAVEADASQHLDTQDQAQKMPEDGLKK